MAADLRAAVPSGLPPRPDGGLDLPSRIMVKNTFIETLDASGTLDASCELDPTPPPGLILERSLTWPTRRSSGAEADRDGSERGSENSEDRDDVPPLRADAEFPLGPYSPEDPLIVSSSLQDLPPNPLELCRVETPEEHIYQYNPLGQAGPSRPACQQSRATTLDACESSKDWGWGNPAFLVRANSRQTALDAYGSGFQPGGPPEGLQPPARGSFVMVPQQNGAQGPYYVQAVSVGPFGHSPVEALSRCDPTPAPPTAAPAVPAGLAGAAGPRCPPPANAPRLEQPPADPAAGLAPRAAPEGGAASSSAGSRAPAHAERAPAPLGLQRELSGASEIHRVRWTVHAKTLTANDKDIVSQPFELNVGVEGPVNFKLGLYPRVSSDARGGASFRRAKGKGRVTLMCTDPVRTQTKLQFRIAVGSESSEGQQPRGPVTHDFFEKRVAELPTGSDEWDFKKVVDASTDTFTVCLEILPASG